MENRVLNLENEVRQLKENNREVEQRISKIEGNRDLQKFQYQTITEALAEIKQDIKELKETPSKRWDLVITGTMTAIIGGAIAYIGSRIL